MMMNKNEIIKREALGMEVGTTRRLPCPFCFRKDTGFAISRILDGILYNCFHASCGAKGFIPSNRNYMEQSKSEIKRLSKQIELNLKPLYKEHLDFLLDKFEINDQDVIDYGIYWEPNFQRIVYSIYDDDKVIGHICRYYKELSNEQNIKSKTLTFKNNNDCIWMNSLWCKRHKRDINPIYIVEDVVSSIKLNVLGHNAIALLGTNISRDLADSLQGSDILIWLDRDAYDKALNYKRMYGLLFNSIKIISTEKDPKNMKYEEIKKELL